MPKPNHSTDLDMGRKPIERVINDPVTRRIRELLSALKGSENMDLRLAEILKIDRSTAGRKLRGAGGWKPNQIRDIAAAFANFSYVIVLLLSMRHWRGLDNTNLNRVTLCLVENDHLSTFFDSFHVGVSRVVITPHQSRFVTGRVPLYY